MAFQANRKNGALLLKIFENGSMIEQFYIDLFNKIKSNDYAVKSLTRIIAKDTLDTPENRKIINDYLMSGLRYSATKGMKRILQIHEFTDMEIQAMVPEEFADFNAWIVLGCPRSTDIDVAVFVGESDHLNGMTKPLSISAMNRLRQELKDCGYDLSRGLDINPIYVDPASKTIIASYKGGSETQNIINATWKYHTQQYVESPDLPSLALPKALVLHPMNDIEFSDAEINNKLRAFAKYVLECAEDICLDYQAFRPIKTAWFNDSGDRMIREMRQILNYIEYNPDKIINTHLCIKRWHDRFKALTMKLLQILLLFSDQPIVYTKKELYESVDKIFENYDSDVIQRFRDCASWYLFRGTMGKFDAEFFPLLIKKYCEFSEMFLNEEDTTIQTIDEQTINQNLIESKGIIGNFIRLFIESPIYYSKEFEEKWNQWANDSKVNSQFIIKSSDPVTFYDKYSQTLSEKIIKVFEQCFIFMDQRSREWLDCLENKFECGNNQGTISNNFQGKYNLIRGAFLEIMAMHFFDPKIIGLDNFKPWFLGFIVENNVKGAKGFAPDMILISDTNDNVPEFILVEIKGLKTLKRNCDYYRGFDLASRQIKSGKDILGKFLKPHELRIDRGLIILCCIEDGEFKMKMQIVPIK